MGAIGSTIGGLIGGTIGTAVVPGIGTEVGSYLGSSIGGSIGNKDGTGGGATSNSGSNALGGMGSAEKAGAAIGLGQMILGKIQQKKADAMLPMGVDPRMAALERYYARKRRASETGTLTNSAKAMLDKTYKESILNAARFGGDASDVQSNYMRNLVGLGQQQGQETMGYAQLYGQTSADIAQIQLEKKLMAYDRQQARSAQNLTEGKQNTGAALMRSIDAKSNSTSDTTVNPKKKKFTWENDGDAVDINTDNTI